MKSALLLSASFILSACVTLPSPSQEKNADYGEYPENYQGITKNYLMAELRDPETVEIRDISSPKKRWIGDPVTGIAYGYLVCVQVNSKNLLGKLTGFRSDALLIRDGSVIDYVKDGKLISGMVLCD